MVVMILATTKIWAVKDSLSRVVDYASNPEKTNVIVNTKMYKMGKIFLYKIVQKHLVSFVQ